MRASILGSLAMSGFLLLSAQSQSAVVSNAANTLFASNTCGVLCSELTWLDDSALIVVRDETGKVIKTQPIEITRDARLVSDIRAGNGGSNRFTAMDASEGPGAPSGGTGSVSGSQTYETATQYVTITTTFVYVGYRLVSVTTSASSINKKDLDDVKVKPK